MRRRAWNSMTMDHGKMRNGKNQKLFRALAERAT